MPSSRQAESDMSDATRRMAEETSRAARTAADASANAARAGAETLQRNAETVQQGWQSGSKIATQLAGRSMEHATRAFGVSQQATEQSLGNTECIVQSGTILAVGMQILSREWVEFVRKAMEQNFQRVDALGNGKTPHDLLAAQSVRANLENFVHNARHLAEISMQVADEAARKMSDATPASR
jgi:phasin family protein